MAGFCQTGRAKSLTLGQVLRAALPDFEREHRLPVHHWKVLHAIAACHTEALGGHQYQCENCGQNHFAPNSCGNRHCPSCQKLKSAQWLEAQVEHLLPIPYFHVVFTLTHELNPLIEHNQKLLYNLLFSSATATLLMFGRNNLGLRLAITAVLHTWSQNLLGHYHLHCVVSGGGISLDGQRWISPSSKWLLPVRSLSIVYRAKFRDGLKQLHAQGRLKFPDAQAHLADPVHFARWLRQICRPQWGVYTKRPFAGPAAVLGYLCRYTHRVAISNRRLEHLDAQKGTVTFWHKDYAQGIPRRSMNLSLGQFLRRFCLHILPPGFVKIRHYGLLANRGRVERIQQARQLLTRAKVDQEVPCDAEWVAPIQPAQAPRPVCPWCGHPTLILVRVIPRPKKPCIQDSS